MTTTVRIPRQVYRSLRLESFYSQIYQRVFPCSPDEFVAGAGDPTSPVVVVGEVPFPVIRSGETADGRMSNLLSKLLTGSGLSRPDVFVTSVVKTEGADVAEFSLKLQSALRVFMQWEIEILKPKVVVALGELACQAFYPGSTVDDVRGSVRAKRLHQGTETLVVPTYALADGLRSSTKRATLYADFQQLKPLCGRNRESCPSPRRSSSRRRSLRPLSPRP